MLNVKILITSHFQASISLAISHMCMPMTYQRWHWQYEWYISRGWWYVDCDEDFRNIHKYILVFAFFNFDLWLSFLKIDAACLLLIMLICAEIVEIQYIILFRTSKQRLWESDASNEAYPHVARELLVLTHTYFTCRLCEWQSSFDNATDDKIIPNS